MIKISSGFFFCCMLSERRRVNEESSEKDSKVNVAGERGQENEI